MHANNSHRWLTMPLLLLPLLTGCAANSTGSGAEPPVVPPLPMEARQGVTPNCSPTCLQRWNQQAEQWRQRLTGAE